MRASGHSIVNEAPAGNKGIMIAASQQSIIADIIALIGRMNKLSFSNIDASMSNTACAIVTEEYQIARQQLVYRELL